MTTFVFFVFLSLGFAQTKGKKLNSSAKPAPAKANEAMVAPKADEQTTDNGDSDLAAKEDQIPVTYFFILSADPMQFKPASAAMERFLAQVPNGTFGPVKEMTDVYHASLPSGLLAQAFKTQFSKVCMFTLAELMDVQRIYQQDPSLLKAYNR